MRRWICALATTPLVFVASVARASDAAAAQALFDQAQALMAQERWAEACPKLEESQRLDPGGGTLLHLAACREHEGKTATAWAHYQDALAAAKRDGRRDRARVAQGRIDALAPRLRKLRIKVAPDARRLPGFRVTRDDTAVGPALWGDPFPVDPGSHTVSAVADGYRRWSVTVDVPEKGGDGVVVVDVPALDAEPAQGPAAAPPRPYEEPRTNRLEDAKRGDTQRTVAYAIGGLGAVGLVVGGVFGGLAFSRKQAADDACSPPDYTRCTAAGVEAGKESRRFGDVSTVAFLAGGALAVGGLALYFTAPRGGAPAARAGVTPVVAPDAVTLAFHGRF